MIYRVVLDDTIDLHTSDIDCMLLNPSLDLEMNSAGSFNFTLPPSHPYWDAIRVLKSTIDVYEDGDLIFTGRIASIEKNWNNERVVQCEGALAYFNDSIHRQMKWETPLPIASEDPTVHNFLKDILDNHNVFEGAENANRHIFIGNITVDPEVVTREVNYDTTLDILTRMCIDTNGGYMSVRKDLNDGKLYLDWIKDFTDESGQPAQFGLNLLNFDTSLAAEDICTGVLARGAEVNEQTVMLNDVELVDETTYPDMSVTHYTTQYQDILWHREGVAKFGQVVQVHDFSDAQTAWKDGQGQIVANSLFEMAKKWLEEKNTKIETIEVEVAELAWLGEGMPKYKLGQIVELSDNVHMAGESYETRLLPMYKLSCDLNSGSKKVTLGTPPKKELTQISASNSDSSTLSSSGSSSGGGGSGEGEECRVHDVKVDGTSVVTDKIANISLAGKADVSTVNALAVTVASKADTSTVNALATLVASKQDALVFNSQDAATAHLTKIKNGNEVYDIPTGTEVEANPTGEATSDLTKLKVGRDIYAIPSGGTEVEANPSDPATDDLNTIKIGDTVYDIPGGGSSTNYGKFTCDVLFVNDPLPTPTSGTGDVNKTYTLKHSIDDYDAVVVEAYGIYFTYDSSNPRQKTTVLVMKNDYYENTQSTEAFRFGSPHHNQLRVLDFDFSNSTTINTTAHRTDSDNEPILYKVYGLKFENKLINRSDIYSEEERMIGRWTDGKPLYQKTVYLQNVTINKDSYTSFTLSNYFSNVEKAISYDVTDDLGRINPLINANSSLKLYDIGVTVEPNSDKFTFSRGNASNVTRSFYFTLRYTKTTDQPGSGVIPEDPQFVMMSDIYSEEEQIIGRWTDGKPIYQKSVTLLDVSASTNTSVEIFDASGLNIENVIDISGTIGNSSKTQVGGVPLISESNNALKGDRIHYYRSDNKFKFDTFNDSWSAADIRFTFQYTKTTDAPGTGPTKGNLIYLPALYSEEEREVGVWTDGKPLYQKTINCGAMPNNDQKTIDISSLNVENIAFSYGSYTDGTRVIILPQGNDRYIEEIANYSFVQNNTIINIASRYRDKSSYTATITFQYTKTTDQPGSGTWTPEGQLAHHYSTSEKIVGTWIDGSTVYERTWSGTCNSDNETLTISSDIKRIVNQDGGIDNSSYDSFISFGYGGNGTDNVQIFRSSSTTIQIQNKYYASRSNYILTLQYTKTS